jgi:hypothetical protein
MAPRLAEPLLLTSSIRTLPLSRPRPAQLSSFDVARARAPASQLRFPSRSARLRLYYLLRPVQSLKAPAVPVHSPTYNSYLINAAAILLMRPSPPAAYVSISEMRSWFYKTARRFLNPVLEVGFDRTFMFWLCKFERATMLSTLNAPSI